MIDYPFFGCRVNSFRYFRSISCDSHDCNDKTDLNISANAMGLILNVIDLLAVHRNVTFLSEKSFSVHFQRRVPNLKCFSKWYADFQQTVQPIDAITNSQSNASLGNITIENRTIWATSTEKEKEMKNRHEFGAVLCIRNNAMHVLHTFICISEPGKEIFE